MDSTSGLRQDRQTWHPLRVSHAEGASEHLLKCTRRGPKALRKQAVETCLSAVEGNMPAQEARKRFEAKRRCSSPCRVSGAIRQR
nr:DUF982 domain-containing protein [Mesorhizobium sp. LNHC252B00]